MQDTGDGPRVSIIMASLNAEQYLRSTIDTVMAQTLERWEIVLMDGGSTDRTIALAESYGDPRIRITQQPDDGVPHAWDRGVDAARGDFVLFLCVSDGFIDATYLSQCVEVMDADPEVSLVWATPAMCDEDGQNLQPYGVHPSTVERYQKQRWILLWLASCQDFPDFNLCVRRPVIRSCMTPYRTGTGLMDKMQEFLFNFNTRGFLPYGLTYPVAYSRRHEGQLGYADARSANHTWAVRDYMRRARRYRQELQRGTATHTFRDGRGQPIGSLLQVQDIPDGSTFDIRTVEGGRLATTSGPSD